MASNTSAQSSTERQIGPSLSMLQSSAMHPKRLTRPKVGRRPVQPQTRHGDTMLPNVSLPIAKPSNPAAVAAAEPAEEPLDPASGFHGLRVIPRNHPSPQARAPSDSLAIRTAPAASSFSATVAVTSNVWF